MAFALPDLPYDYKDLEPHIDEETMRIHHGKHHAGYTNNLNAALEEHPDLAEKSIEELLGDLDSIAADIRVKVQNNGGGFANHSLFWKTMSPDGGGEPEGELLEALDKSFGGYDTFREKFTVAAASHFGSGWVWLTYEKDGLHVCTTANQDTPLMKGNTPLLGLDVWEHAYHLKHQNRRAEYIMAWWNVINWSEVTSNLKKAQK